LTGEEVFEISGVSDAVQTGGQVRVRAVRPDGTNVSLEAQVRVDTPQEIEYYRNGGILPFVLRQLAASNRQSA
jgi:aconitate hydratase